MATVTERSKTAMPKKARNRSERTWYDCIVKVLAEKGEAMRYADIADTIVKRPLRRNVGATPNQTVSHILSTSVKKQGTKSPFKWVSPGVYELSGAPGSSAAEKKEVEQSALRPAELADEIPSIGAFGMYWRRDMVKWSGNQIRLTGRQKERSNPVDFGGQVGVYLLHDHDRIIYVGKVDASDRLGARLKEHTVGRMAYRWDRFSWFGLRTPTTEGKLEGYTRQFSEKDLIGLMEAILIEAIEPGLNRKRGEGLREVEFYQAEDPTFQKDRSKTALLEMIQRLSNSDDVV